MLTLLKNCMLSNNKKVNILIKDEIIYKISDEEIIDNTYEGEKIEAVFDIKNNLVMPGIIDGFSRTKNLSAYGTGDFETESKACATGGITTYVDIPSNPISEDYFDVLSKKVRDANKKSLVNFAFAVNVSDQTDTKELMKIQEYAAGTLFSISTRNLRERISDSDNLKKMMKCSKIVLIHLSGTDIDLFFTACDDMNTKIIFYGITNEQDLEKILMYRKIGYNIRTATSINYLLFNRDQLVNEYKRKTITADYKLGTMLNNIGLWNAIKEGKIDMITSDHYPITLIEKFETLKPGLPNFETLFSVLFDSCYFKRISITILEKLLCKNPAKIYGFKNKGEIKEGYDADIIIVNTTKRWWIKNEDIVSQARWTPFNDYRISGRVMMTFVNGQLVYNYINQMMPIRNVKAAKMVTFDNEILFKEGQRA